MEETFQKSIDDLGRLYRFTKEELAVLRAADKAAEELAVPEYEHYMKREFNTELLKILVKHDLLGIPIKKKYGGKEMDPIIYVLAKERLGQLGMGISSFINVQMLLCEQIIQRWGTEEQRKTYLQSGIKGKTIFAFALTEVEAGSDPSSMKSSYRRRNGGYVLNGTKYLISNGTIADRIFVFARSAANPKEISAFIVDAKSNGVERTELKEKIGLFTSDTGLLQFNDVVVPEKDRMGNLGEGLHIAYSGLLSGRLGVASGCVGVIEGSLIASLKRASEHVQHGKPIGKHQLIQQHISAIRQNLEMARWPTYFAALVKARYDKDAGNKELLNDAELRVSLAKRIASRLAFESADRAVQIFGGFGYSLMSPVGQLLCDSRVARIYEGTDEIQDLKIASLLLGKDFAAYG